eukprot:g2781.t1
MTDLLSLLSSSRAYLRKSLGRNEDGAMPLSDLPEGSSSLEDVLSEAEGRVERVRCGPTRAANRTGWEMKIRECSRPP